MKKMKFITTILLIVVMVLWLLLKTVASIYSILVSTRNEIVGAIFGVPGIVASIAFIVIGVTKYILKRLFD